MAVSLLISETTPNWCRNLGCRSDSVKQTISLKICVSWNQLVSYTNPLASGCKVKWGEEASLGSCLETILLKCICGHSLPQTTNFSSFWFEQSALGSFMQENMKGFQLGEIWKFIVTNAGQEARKIQKQGKCWRWCRSSLLLSPLLQFARLAQVLYNFYNVSLAGIAKALFSRRLLFARRLWQGLPSRPSPS